MESISAAMNTVNVNSPNPGSPKPGAAVNASPESEPDRLSQYPAHFANTYWRSLHYFNLYRMIAAGLLLLAHLFLGGRHPIGAFAPNLFVLASVAYLMFCSAVIFDSNALAALRSSTLSASHRRYTTDHRLDV